MDGRTDGHSVMHGRTDAEVASESEERVSFHDHFMNFMNRLYGPNMELIHPRIAKLWAKEKCDAWTNGCRCGCRK
jgi:hypothetical protein